MHQVGLYSYRDGAVYGYSKGDSMKEGIAKLVKKLVSRLLNTVEPIKKGESIGILGVAGTGKSRLAKEMSLTHKKLLVYARETYPGTEEINLPNELQGYKEMDSCRLTLKEARYFEGVDDFTNIGDVEGKALNNDELPQNTFDEIGILSEAGTGKSHLKEFLICKRKDDEYRDKLCSFIREAGRFEDTLVIIDDVEDKLLNNNELFQNTFDDKWFRKGNSLILICQMTPYINEQLNVLNRIVVFRTPAYTLGCLKLDRTKAQSISRQEPGEYQILWNRSSFFADGIAKKRKR